MLILIATSYAYIGLIVAYYLSGHEEFLRDVIRYIHEESGSIEYVAFSSLIVSIVFWPFLIIWIFKDLADRKNNDEN